MLIFVSRGSPGHVHGNFSQLSIGALYVTGHGWASLRRLTERSIVPARILSATMRSFHNTQIAIRVLCQRDQSLRHFHLFLIFLRLTQLRFLLRARIRALDDVRQQLLCKEEEEDGHEQQRKLNGREAGGER